MKSSPRTFRLTQAALDQLAVLKKLHPTKGCGELVSEAIISAARQAAAAPPIQLGFLVPEDVCFLQTALLELESKLRALRQELLKINTKDPAAATKIAAAATAAEVEIHAIRATRLRIARLGFAADHLDANDIAGIRLIIELINSTAAKIKSEKPELSDFYSMAASLLTLLIK